MGNIHSLENFPIASEYLCPNCPNIKLFLIETDCIKDFVCHTCNFSLNSDKPGHPSYIGKEKDANGYFYVFGQYISTVEKSLHLYKQLKLFQ